MMGAALSLRLDAVYNAKQLTSLDYRAELPSIVVLDTSDFEVTLTSFTYSRIWCSITTNQPYAVSYDCILSNGRPWSVAAWSNHFPC